MTDSNSNDSINYKVGEKIKMWRLNRGYKQKYLAYQVGITCWMLLQHEKGKQRISIENLYAVAKALSVSIVDLLPEQVIDEERSFEEERLEIIERYGKIKNQGLSRTVYELVKSAQMSEESNREVAKIEVARNLVKEGVSIDIIEQTTGLSNDKYNKKEEVCGGSIYYKIGQRIRKLRLMRAYTQEDLGNTIGLMNSNVCRLEQGRSAISLEILYKIAEALSVDVTDLLPESTEEDYEGNSRIELVNLIKEYKKVENLEARKELYELIKSLSEDVHLYEEKVRKAEKTKIAKNLEKAGISADIIYETTGYKDFIEKK